MYTEINECHDSTSLDPKFAPLLLFDYNYYDQAWEESDEDEGASDEDEGASNDDEPGE